MTLWNHQTLTHWHQDQSSLKEPTVRLQCVLRVWRIASDEYWRDYTKATTIPQYFKENSYVSIGMGKILHPGAPNGNDDIAYSWSLPYYHSPLQVTNRTSSWWSFEGYEDNQLPDGQIANNAIKSLKELKQNMSQGNSKLLQFILPCRWLPQTSLTISCS